MSAPRPPKIKRDPTDPQQAETITDLARATLPQEEFMAAQAVQAEAQNNKPKREFRAPRETRRVRVIRGGPMLPVNKEDPPMVYLEVRVSEWVSLGDGTQLGMYISAEEAERVGQIIERSIKAINTDRWPSLDGV